MKKLFVIFALFVTSALAEGISWKTFDVKLGPYVSGYDDYDATGVGLNLQVVKPFTPYIGAGLFLDVGVAATMSTDCDSYKFAELTEGLLLNLNIPISSRFSIVSNYMVGVVFRDGTFEGGGFMNPPVVTVRDRDGNEAEGVLISGYNDYEESDYYTESVQFRSNLGVSFRTASKRFGVEFYPVDFAFDKDVRMTFSLNAAVRIF